MAGKAEGTEAEDGKPAPVSDRTLLITFGMMVVVGLCNNIFRVLQFGPMHNVRGEGAPASGLFEARRST